LPRQLGARLKFAHRLDADATNPDLDGTVEFRDTLAGSCEAVQSRVKSGRQSLFEFSDRGDIESVRSAGKAPEKFQVRIGLHREVHIDASEESVTDQCDSLSNQVGVIQVKRCPVLARERDECVKVPGLVRTSEVRHG
jgi:hypothetical protein